MTKLEWARELDARKTEFMRAAKSVRADPQSGELFFRGSVEPMHEAAVRYFVTLERAIAASEETGLGPGELSAFSLADEGRVVLRSYLKYWDMLGRISERAGKDLHTRFRPDRSAFRLIQAALKVIDPDSARVLEAEFRDRGLPVSGFQDPRVIGVLRSAWTPEAVPIGAPTILWMSANPMGTRRLGIDEEIRQIKRGLPREAFDFQPHGAVHPSDVQDYLTQYRPPIVHFSGHGDGSDGIILCGADGPTKLSTDALVALFGTAPARARVVVLSACRTAEEAEALVTCVDGAVGVDGEIPDKAATVFNRRFYVALAGGLSVGAAVSQGKAELLAGYAQYSEAVNGFYRFPEAAEYRPLAG